MTSEEIIEVTIGLWDKDVPVGQNPPRLAAVILNALHVEGYRLVDANLHVRSIDGDGEPLHYCSVCFQDWPCAGAES